VSVPKGYFDREPKITNQAQMMETLKARAGAQAKLAWLPPVRATQKTVCGRYELRAARSGDKLIYWAWVLVDVPSPKLIGHDADAAIARNYCETDLRHKEPT